MTAPSRSVAPMAVRPRRLADRVAPSAGHRASAERPPVAAATAAGRRDRGAGWRPPWRPRPRPRRPPAAAAASVTDDGLHRRPRRPTDYGWNQQGAMAPQAAAESIGAERPHGRRRPATRTSTPILNQLAEDGAQFIVAQASGYNHGRAAVRAGEQHPGRRLRQARPDDAGARRRHRAPTASEGGYLAGVLAAR